MIDVSEYFVVAFILIGAFFGLVTAIGLIRLPDLYTRTHAASKSATLGVMSVLLGALLFFLTEEVMFNSRIVLGIFFVLITAPVGGHLIARAAYNTGVELAPETVHDDLAKKEQFEAKKKKNSSRD